MTPVLPFWLQTAEWDIDDDANIVFTPHCPHQEFVHNDDDDGLGHNDDDDDDDSIKGMRPFYHRPFCHRPFYH